MGLSPNGGQSPQGQPFLFAFFAEDEIIGMALTKAMSCDKLFIAAGMADVVRRLICPETRMEKDDNKKTLASGRSNVIYYKSRR